MHHPNPFKRWWWIITFILLLQIPLQHLYAQKAEVFQLTIHPSPEPVPALKYRLTTDVRLKKPGNAAVYYGKIGAEQEHFFSQPNLNNDLSRLASASKDEVLKSDLASNLANYPYLTYYIHQAAMCRHCDWQLPIGTEPAYDIRIPEIQESRNYAKLSTIAARFQIAEQNYEAAIVSLQDLIEYAKNVSSKPAFSVNYYVGNFINRMALDQIEFWVQQPDSPNLYWALSTLPPNLFDDWDVQDLGRHDLELTFAPMSNVESDNYSEAYWNQAIIDLRKLSHRLSERQVISIEHFKLIQAYPRAKQFLAEQGFTPEQIAAMPAARVILLAALREDQIRADRLIRWRLLGHHRGKFAQEASDSSNYHDQKNSVLPELFPDHFMNRTTDTRWLRVRTERRVALLRVIEAIRMQGTLPASLSEITAVPVPVDPATDEPFGYELANGVARVKLPYVASLSAGQQVYEITMPENAKEAQ